MASRSIGSVTILFGLVAIPAKLHTAHAKKEVSFNRLVRGSGARVKQLIVSAADGEHLKSDDIVSGFEYTPDQFVTFTPEELKALELEGDPGRVRIAEVVPRATLDPSHIVKTVNLSPDKGADRPYHLLATQLAARGAVAVGQRGGRTRDDLVVIAPIVTTLGVALRMHECLYADEVRGVDELQTSGVAISDVERKLADRLLDGLERPNFDAGRFADGGSARLKAAVDTKVDGRQIVIPPPQEAQGPIDLLEQLRASVPGPKKARRAPASSPVRSARRPRAASA